MDSEESAVGAKIILALCASGIVLQGSSAFSSKTNRWKRQTCLPYELNCDSGECVAGFMCDGIADCKDSSDETLGKCQNFLCPAFGFRCDYGACVDADVKCDGKKDCADNSDEKDCPLKRFTLCKPKQFECNSSICIDTLLLCDGTEDCDDGSDETFEACQNISWCPHGGFQCDYGGCIDADGRCNGIEQCADGSDENKCMKPQKNISITTTTPIAPTQSNATQGHSAGCVLPPQPKNGHYALRGCDSPACSPVPGDHVHNTFINYTCHNNFVLIGSEFLYCDRDWSASFPTCSQVSCKPLINPTRDIECIFNNEKVACDKSMAPGTKATVQCTERYTSDAEFADIDTECQDNGKWSPELTSCQPKCGEPNPHGLPFISGAENANYGEFPWHAGLYILQENNIIHICGGSIISERTIVTAAHCFWNDVENKENDVKLYKIAVGKYYSDWNNTMEEYVQIPEIQEVKLHEMFRGDKRRFENDIAVIILKGKLRMTKAVGPICVDYAQKYNNYFSTGKKGIVVGWGLTEQFVPSATLRTTTLPYVNFEDCVEAVPDGFIPYLTSDRFCAGYTNGTSVCPGDSGGGYASKFKDGKWYLMGLVSVGVPGNASQACSKFYYTTLTKVFAYYDFVKRYRNLT